jgi:hypothetical protein
MIELHLSRVSRAEIDLGPVSLRAEVAAAADELRSREPRRRIPLFLMLPEPRM